MRRVSGDTLRETTECEYEFHCLEEGGWNMCPVREPSRPSGVRLELCRREQCKYLVSQDGVDICVCPTRCELYEGYGL